MRCLLKVTEQDVMELGFKSRQEELGPRLADRVLFTPWEPLGGLFVLSFWFLPSGLRP